jgi:sec-independent protein translocase protein TatA
VPILPLAALIVLGPKKLPEAGRAMGKGMREFKDSINGVHDEDEKPAIKSE